jgi:hypothetical protein
MLVLLALAKDVYLITPTPELKIRLLQTALRKNFSTLSEHTMLQAVVQTVASAHALVLRTFLFIY